MSMGWFFLLSLNEKMRLKPRDWARGLFDSSGGLCQLSTILCQKYSPYVLRDRQGVECLECPSGLPVWSLGPLPVTDP